MVNMEGYIYSTLPGIKGFISPRRYVQGPNILPMLGKFVKMFGRKALAFADEDVTKIVRDVVIKSFSENGIGYRWEIFGRECSWEEINRLKKIGEDENVEMVIGFGGGKAIDTAKAVGNILEVPIITVPTIASTDAPTSSISVIYTEPYPGEWVEDVFWPRNPDLVFVDTNVIANAGPRFLSAGMGDASSKYFEGLATVQANKHNFVYIEYKPKPVEPLKALTIGIELGRATWERLKAFGRAAFESAKKNLVTPALEIIVETNILLSGLAFENTGVAAAHAVYFGFTYIERKYGVTPMHGELVAFGTIVELVLEGRPLDMILDYMKWAHEVGLPINLDELGFRNIADEDLWRVAQKSSEAYIIKNEPFEVTQEMIFNAIKYADSIGTKFSKIYPREQYR